MVDDTRKSLEMLAITSQSFESTDPRDKVYALLGLFERDRFAMVPDYIAITARVYVNVVKAIKEFTGSLSLVACTSRLDHPQGPIPGLPPWAPDLRGNRQREPNWGAFLTHAASSLELARSVILPDNRVLRADTLVVDHILLIDADKDKKADVTLSEKLCPMGIHCL